MDDGATRTEKLPFGLVVDGPGGGPGSELGEVERAVPADEPPPLPPNNRLSVVGKPVPRLDGRLKVTGAARYTVDILLPGMLHARVLRSPYPNARVRAIDTSAAERYPGVRAVHIVDEVVGLAVERDPGHLNPQYVRSPSQVPPLLYVGADIAAVAATTAQAAEEALRLIKVDYEVLPFVVDMDQARKPDAPLVFGGPTEQAATGGGGGAPPGIPQVGNVRGPVEKSPFGGPRGDIEQGLAQAEVVIEGEFRTQVQTHCCLEIHAVVADWRPDGLTVYTSTQDTISVRDDLAHAFGLPISRVRVICEYMGGGFGSKFGAGNYGRAAVHLSRKAGAPVRLVLDRREEQLVSGNRPSTWQKLRVGARRDGTLTAISLLAYGTAGTALGAGVGHIAQMMYACPNFSMEQYDVLTHAGPGCAMRAPGNVQGAFGLEQVIDELAQRLSLDPVVLRDRIDPNPVRREQRRVGVQQSGWAQRHAPGADTRSVKRGIGMAQSFWPGIVQTGASCEVRLFRDGSVEVLSSVQDIGTGTRTTLAQVVAEELGLRPEDIAVRIGDTNFPAGPGSGGSKTAGSVTPAARNATYQVKQTLLRGVAPALQVPAEDLAVGEGRVFVRREPAKGLSFHEAAAKLKAEQVSATASRAPDYGGFQVPTGTGGLAHEGLGGVQFVEVSVDTETGQVRVERVVGVHDCGRPINPLQIESQVNGGILQGISFALFEDRILDQSTGHMVNPNLEAYKIIGAADAPRIEVVLLQNYQGRSSTDARGIGEPAIIATAAAVANAVYNALGVRIRELPITPARVLAALGKTVDKTGRQA